MLSPRKSRGFRPTPFIASEIKRFSKTNSFVLAAWAFFYLVSIFLLGYLSLRIHAELGTAASIIPFLLIAVAIARQQRALENLVHSASHFEFSRKNKKLNDFLGNVLAAFPVANIVEDYRKGHFLHHRAYNSELDPCKKRNRKAPEYLNQQLDKSLMHNGDRLGKYLKIEMMLTFHREV